MPNKHADSHPSADSSVANTQRHTTYLKLFCKSLGLHYTPLLNPRKRDYKRPRRKQSISSRQAKHHRPKSAENISFKSKAAEVGLAPEQVLDMHYALFGYTGEPPLDQLPTAGLSAETVAIETSRAIEDVNAAIPIYPGIDIDVPTGLNEKRTQPSDVRAATLAALKAGAPGVVLSRKYAEMKLSNIAGATQALENSGAGR